jgi:3-methyladenine DNA glycosylase AlkD
MSDLRRVVEAIERGLRRRADPDRAAGAKRYLKSDLEFIGVTTPEFRAEVREALHLTGPPERDGLLAAAAELWARPVFELRAAAVELLDRHVRQLDERDLATVEAMIRAARTWALVDWLATRVAAPLVDRHPELSRDLDRWAGDDEFWVRRAAMLALLPALRRGGGDLDRFCRYADAMLDEREFFIRKAIGWVLREVAKKRPAAVAQWLRPRVVRASGLTVREAVKYLDAATADELRAAQRRGAPPPAARRRSQTDGGRRRVE